MKKISKILGFLVILVLAALVLSACDLEDKLTPTGVVATALEGRNVHLTWNASSGASYYEVAWRSEIDSKDTRRPAGTATITTLNHYAYGWAGHNTSAGERLYYYVRAHSHNYNWEEGYRRSDWSAEVSVVLIN